MSRKFQGGQYADRKGTLIEGHVRNIDVLGEGPTVPADGLAGYTEGALFLLRGGPAAGSLFINQGTSTSCSFRPASMAFARQVPGVAGGVAPGSTGSDIVVGVISLPANYFVRQNQGITLTASGNFANNANTKRCKLWFNATTAVINSAITGGTLLADTGAVVTANLGWLLEGSVIKTGAPGSNTQTTISQGAIAGGTHAGIVLNADTAAVESGVILCAVTINNTTAAGDAVLSMFEADGWN